MKGFKIESIYDEVQVLTSRSGGPGGQHVNKVETKVTLKWNVKNSKHLNDLQKQLILVSNRNKLTKDGELIISADSKRSQLRNKEIAYKKLERCIKKAFLKKRKRIQTTPTKASRLQRLKDKKHHSDKKSLRKKISQPD